MQCPRQWWASAVATSRPWWLPTRTLSSCSHCSNNRQIPVASRHQQPLTMLSNNNFKSSSSRRNKCTWARPSSRDLLVSTLRTAVAALTIIICQWWWRKPRRLFSTLHHLMLRLISSSSRTPLSIRSSRKVRATPSWHLVAPVPPWTRQWVQYLLLSRRSIPTPLTKAQLAVVPRSTSSHHPAPPQTLLPKPKAMLEEPQRIIAVRILRLQRSFQANKGSKWSLNNSSRIEGELLSRAAISCSNSPRRMGYANNNNLRSISTRCINMT